MKRRRKRLQSAPAASHSFFAGGSVETAIGHVDTGPAAPHPGEQRSEFRRGGASPGDASTTCRYPSPTADIAVTAAMESAFRVLVAHVVGRSRAGQPHANRARASRPRKQPRATCDTNLILFATDPPYSSIR